MILRGDARRLPLADESVHCVVTSPPYWGMRNYDCAGQIGLEETLEEYLAALLVVFSEVRRILRRDGTCWINMGDRYVSAPSGPRSGHAVHRPLWHARTSVDAKPTPPLPRKNLIGLPWRVALALQANGWFLRCDVIWHKPNPMPETVHDRPTRCHEYVFLLTQADNYFYDAAALSEPASWNSHSRGRGVTPKSAPAGSGIKANEGFHAAVRRPVVRRNGRSVWRIHPKQEHKGGHQASFPVELARRCIKAGCPLGGMVLDPFAGSGTTLVAAEQLGRVGIGLELSEIFCSEAAGRLAAPLQRDLLEGQP